MMKNTITITFVLIFLSVTVFGQKAGPVTQDASYTIDFVFTGEIQNQVDSLFSLQYTFSTLDVQNLRKVTLEDSKGQYQLSLSESGLQGDMEVRTEKDRVIVIVHKYDKYNLPVLTRGEDILGAIHTLYLSTGTGERISSEQFKAQLQSQQQPVKQAVQTTIPEPGKHK